MPHQRSLTLLPRKVEDFPRGVSHSKHMRPLTYLDWLQPIYYNSRFVFIHIKIAKVFTCVENFNKKIIFFCRFSFGNIIFLQVQFWKYYFFPGSVLKVFFFQVQFLRIRWLSRSATTLISQQPWKHKAVDKLNSNHQL